MWRADRTSIRDQQRFGLLVSGLTVHISAIRAPRANAVQAAPPPTSRCGSTREAAACDRPVADAQPERPASASRADWPQIALSEGPVNQDGCEQATLTLGFTATARKGRTDAASRGAARRIAILAGVAVLAAVGRAAGYWTGGGSGCGKAQRGKTSRSSCSAGARRAAQLSPGHTTDVAVMASNPNPFPVRVASLVIDTEGRDAEDSRPTPATATVNSPR